MLQYVPAYGPSDKKMLWGLFLNESSISLQENYYKYCYKIFKQEKIYEASAENPLLEAQSDTSFRCSIFHFVITFMWDSCNSDYASYFNSATQWNFVFNFSHIGHLFLILIYF